MKESLKSKIFDFKNNFRHFIALYKKNLRFNTRDIALFSLNMLTPVILIIFFSITIRFIPKSEVYSIGILNNDKLGISNDPALNFSSRISIDFINQLKEIKNIEDDGESNYYSILESYGGKQLTFETGKQLCDETIIDAFIVIPENFSEVIFGATWWYRFLKLSNHSEIESFNHEYNLNDTIIDLLNQNNIEYDPEIVLTLFDYINATDFPLSFQPELTLYISPDVATRAIISSTVETLVSNIILMYNGLDFLNITVLNRNDIGNFSLNIGDTFMPYYILICALFPISGTSYLVIKEKLDNTFSFIDSTHVSRFTNFLSIQASQFTIIIAQSVTILICLNFSGTYIHPNADFWLLLLLLSVTSLTSINIGLFIGIKTKLHSVAQIYSFLLMIFLQLLGGSYIPIDPTIGKLVPSYWANQISIRIIIDGLGFAVIGEIYGILVIFLTISIIMSLISFIKWKPENTLF